MPRKYVRRARKRPVAARRTRKRAVSGGRNQGRAAGFPASKTVSLVYSGTTTLTSTASMAKWVLRCNSAFDPDHSGAGHQPMGYDTWSNVYNHYTVLSATLSATYTPVAAPTYAYSVGIYGPSDDTTVPTNSGDMLENRRGVNRLRGLDPHVVTHLNRGFNRKSFYGSTLDEGQTSSAVTTNPSEEAFWTLYAQSMYGIHTVDLYVQYRIVYKVKFYEPKDQAQN